MAAMDSHGAIFASEETKVAPNPPLALQPSAFSHSTTKYRRLRWFSDKRQFTRAGRNSEGGRTLLREGGPISYEARPSRFCGAT